MIEISISPGTIESRSDKPGTMVPHDLVGIVLAGGMGTRLQSVAAGVPKPFIHCAGRPFISWVIDASRRAGVPRFVVSLGHLHEVAERELAAICQAGYDVKAVVEPAPLGTAGAIRFAWETCRESPVFVQNGDSLLFADLSPVWQRWARGDLDALLVGTSQNDAARYGTLRFDDDGLLCGFEEKRPGRGVINAGIYLLRPALLAAFPDKSPLSLELDVWPRWLLEKRRIGVVVLDGPFLDIGLPESLAQAGEFIEANSLGQA